VSIRYNSMIMEYICGMVRNSLHQSIAITHEQLELSAPVAHNRNTYFQMIYIVIGTGVFLMNDNRTSYKEGSLLLLTPVDAYGFEIAEATSILSIKFNLEYLRKTSWKPFDGLECLLYHASHVSGCVMRSKTDMHLVKTIVGSLLQELDNNNSMELMCHFVNALIVIAARNINQIMPEGLSANADRRIQDIILHIQTNINNPEQLKAAYIAERFGMATTYLGPYFKRACGETIQQFIAGYRIRLIEHRLLFSDLRIGEIAHEFGFTDESHLNKFFKKHKEVSLTAFRKRIHLAGV
jgi:AraC-like DNA-binding protein